MLETQLRHNLLRHAQVEGSRVDQGLANVDGTNLIIEYRSSAGRPERFPVLAAELLQLHVDLIVTRGTPAEAEEAYAR